ncbi:alpha-aminoadipic semialdehyde synthase, mitochondrial-like [Rhopilema esculentum]|uniref:alpha-aminoadipic semialdehyde synthase, mitochondrial-like n=1 Tax=Rhopilema esculentum TaxID=499914 RepID=UPI0031D73063
MQRMNLRNIQKIARPYFQQFSYQHGWRVLSSKPHLSKTKVESGKILALRREDINVWERRAPIAPQHIKSLKEQGINTLVQPSARRAYTMQEYENAGAIITEDLSPASVIIGVKQVPIDLLIPDKSYAFFSHTIKAQEANMPLLDAMLAKNIRIIDYERMVDENGQRVAAFGKFAGFAVMINILHGIGLRLLALGHHTPFMYIGAAHNCKNSRQAKLAIYELGEDIKAGKLPAHFGPLTFVFTGSGNVSQGAQEMFKELPHVYVEPHELKHAAQKYDHRTLVYTKVSRQDYLVPKLGGSFQASEFEAHPERYRSVFAEEIAPYANVIINGVYWASKNPRLLTYKDALTLLEPKTEHDKNSGCPDLPHTLLAICDISNDLGGSIEFMKENTTIECPFALHDIKKGTKQLGTAGDGVLICSIENLPAQLPREATDYFGRLLLPWIPEMVNCDARRPLSMESGISNVVKNAIICSNGELTENYKYIADLRARHENERKQAKLGFQSSVSKKILVLGAGKVSSPFIEYHTRRQSTGVTVVSRSKDRVQHLANRHENTTPVVLDIERSHEGLDKLIQSHDVVVSLLPYLHSPTIASLCIKHKKNMVTATYVLPAMKELHERAKEAGITIFQENGLDPGIDHLLAMDCIDSIKEEGGKVESFISYCGGLPAPEHSDNPLRYKFSWSPNDTLLTLLNGARFLKNGQLMEIEPGMLLENVSPLDIFPGFHLEGYPNRDSTKYVQSFNIPEVKTMLRSAIRYHGYAAVCRGILSLGLLKKDPYPANMVGKTSSWKDLMNLQFGRFTLSEKELEILVRGRLQNDEIAFQGVKGLGLLSEESVQIGQTPFDTLSTHLSRILEYSKGERDIVLLRLQIREFKNNGKRVQHDISLVEYGDPNGFSAMARTTGIPTAIAADMVLNGEILQTGNVTPFAKGIYKPMLKRIQAEDICWTHKTTEL